MTELRHDLASAAPLRGLAALLDHDRPPWREGEVPPLGHWLYFLPDASQSELGEDGHPRRTDPLVAEFPRRMWAGGRIAFPAPIPIGSALTRETRTLASERKSGRSGEMMLVTLEHRIVAGGELAIVEEQDLVYRQAATAARPVPLPQTEVGPADDECMRTIVPDEAALFRYSALTFNAHRIHYDLPYAHEREGYPGLVVHGPLLATLLADHWLRGAPGARLSSFSFRAERPAFCGQPITLWRDRGLLSASAAGQVAMRAEVIA
jgi:3-methylfumaryl-CoA hydratase